MRMSGWNVDLDAGNMELHVVVVIRFRMKIAHEHDETMGHVA